MKPFHIFLLTLLFAALLTGCGLSEEPDIRAEFTIPTPTPLPAEPVETEDATSEVAEAATEEATETTATEEVPPPESITVHGQVTNQTPGGSIPGEAPVTLHIFDSPDFAETTLQTTLDDDGSYTFTDVGLLPDHIFVVSLSYDDVVFTSTFYAADDLRERTLDTTISILESTTDPEVVVINSGVMQIRFSSFGLQINQVLSFENMSDRQYLSEEFITEDRRATLIIPLPPGSTGVGLGQGQEMRFEVDEVNAVITDTQPLSPGTHEIVFSYFLPYTDGAIIEQELLYPLEGAFHLLIESREVTVESDLFTLSEPVEMGANVFDLYIAELNLIPGEVVSFTLLGEPQLADAQTDSASEEPGGSPSLLVLLLALSGLVMLGVGTFLFMRQGQEDQSIDAKIDALIDEIARLDDQHERGEINHDLYQHQRKKLKAKLADLMQDGGDQ